MPDYRRVLGYVLPLVTPPLATRLLATRLLATRLLATLLVVTAACGDDDALHCDGAVLAEVLAEAVAGDVVRVGACTVSGTLSVPAGVTLEGEGSASVLTSESGSVVELAADATLRAVQIDAYELGVVARGAGVRTLEGVVVRAARGAGVATTGSTLVLSDVTIVGPVEDPNDASLVRVAGFRVVGTCPDDGICECTPGDVRTNMGDTGRDEVCDADGAWATWTAVYGIYARDAALTLTDVRVDGFAEAGAVLERCEVTWDGGGARGNLGLGVLAREGTTTLRDVALEETAEGLRGLASYALLAVDGALEADGLRLVDNDRYGLLAQNVRGRLGGLVAEDHGDVALWVADAESFVVEGASRISRAAFAGVVVSASQGVRLEGLEIADTRSVTRTLGDLFGAQTLGDGAHLSAAHDGVVLRDVVVRGNARSGLVVDLAGGAPSFENVSVDAVADGFGAVAGARAAGTITGDAPGGWDVGIVRSELASVRDAAAVGERFDAIGLDAPASARDRLGIVFPMF